jgi:DNA polymerase III subunit beta
MIINTLQENLLRALIKTSRVVPAKPQLPVLQNILLTAKDGVVTITATNLETTEIVSIGAKIEKEGGVCVPSRLFLEFVSSLPQSTVTIATKEGSVLVTCGGYRATIPGMNASEFPQIPEKTKKGEVTIQKDEIVSAVQNILFSAATDEGRPILTGIRIIQKEEETTLAATDGYRLSVKKISLKTKEPMDLLVPARALGEVVKACVEDKDTKAISLTKPTEGQISFLTGDTEIRTRLIDGEYPSFEKIIPGKHNTRVLFEKAALEKAVKAAAVFARDNANIVRFHIENQTVTLSANTPQVGEDEIDVDAKVDGEGGDIAFNSRFLLEFLANYSGDELLFEMTGSLNPGVFKPVKDDSYLHIIMPVRVTAQESK